MAGASAGSGLDEGGVLDAGLLGELFDGHARLGGKDADFNAKLGLCLPWCAHLVFLLTLFIWLVNTMNRW